MKPVSAFMIVKNEAELVQYTMESFAMCADSIENLSIVDNGSTDDTLKIIRSFSDKLDITIRIEPTIKHHGALRTMAMAGCAKTDWIFYLDGDETCDSSMASFLRNLFTMPPSIYTVRFPKYWTIIDRNHYIAGSQDHQCRLFRNADGVMFNQKIHTEPVYSWGNGRERCAELPFENSPTIFDHTSLKSQEKLLEKGQRYQWAVGEPFIGAPSTYLDLTQKAMAENKWLPLPDELRKRVTIGKVSNNA